MQSLAFLVEIICKAVSGEPPFASCSQYNLNILPIFSIFQSRTSPARKNACPNLCCPAEYPPACIRARQCNHFWFRISSHTIFHPLVYFSNSIITIHKHTIQPSSLRISFPLLTHFSLNWSIWFENQQHRGFSGNKWMWKFWPAKPVEHFFLKNGNLMF